MFYSEKRFGADSIFFGNRKWTEKICILSTMSPQSEIELPTQTYLLELIEMNAGSIKRYCKSWIFHHFLLLNLTDI